MLRTIKEFIKFYIPVVVAIVAISAWFLYWRNTSHLELMKVRQAQTASALTQVATMALQGRIADVRFLARLTARHIGMSDHASYHTLENEYSDFSRSRASYLQIRYIDAKGMERIRIDRSFAGPVSTPKAALQDKSDRYYVQRTLGAGRDAVYVSRFDLNVENGAVQKPYQPTLRFCSPVIDNDGYNRGLVVINYNGQLLMDRIRRQATMTGSMALLSSSTGHWMIGPSPQEEWGHVFKSLSMATFANRFPKVWAISKDQESSQVMTPQGLFSVDTVDIVPDRIVDGTIPTIQENKRRWRVVTWVPTENLRLPWAQSFTMLNGLLMVLLGMGCWYLVRHRISRLEVEEHLRENEELTMAISRSTMDGIIVVDDQSVITHWNPAAEQLLGYRAEAVLGRRLHEVILPPQTRDKADKGFERFKQSGQGPVVDKTFELNAERSDGTTVPVEIAISSFHFRDQWYAVGSVRDTSKRKQDELELRRSEELARALINAPTESIVLLDPGGTILDINEIGARRFDSTVTDIVGRSLHDHISSSASDEIKGIMRRVMTTGSPTRCELVHKGMLMLANVYPVKDPDGKLDRVAMFLRDITEQREAQAALLQSEQRFRDISESVSEFIWELDRNGRINFMTGKVMAVLGRTPSELIGKDPASLFPEEQIGDFREWMDSVFANKEPFFNVEIRLPAKDGAFLWLLVTGIPYFEAGEFMGFRGAGRNITGRKTSENAIKANERKLRALAESAYDAIVMFDASGTVSFWNHAAMNMFGYTEEEALGNQVQTLLSTDENWISSERIIQELAASGAGEATGVIEEALGRRKDGTQFPVERSVAGFRLNGQWHAVATLRDITKRKATEAKLRELATTDSLTGLNNRRRFLELSQSEFARSVRYNRPLTLFMLDIDHFKRVNDTHGHDVGDVVLQSLAETSINALRAADILGRLGGEEFAAMLPETGIDAAMDVAERLRQSIERTAIDTSAGPLNITISIGVASLSSEVRNLKQLLKNADIALYEAKQGGRNRTVKG